MRKLARSTMLFGVLLIFAVTLVACTGNKTNGEGSKVGANEYTTVPQEVVKPEGYLVYYVAESYFFEGSEGVELLIKTTQGKFVKVSNIAKNLSVTVDSKYPGTVLVVKHFSFPILSEADNAELVVRAEEDAMAWRAAIIQKTLEWKIKQERISTPKDLLP